MTFVVIQNIRGVIIFLYLAVIHLSETLTEGRFTSISNGLLRTEKLSLDRALVTELHFVESFFD